MADEWRESMRRAHEMWKRNWEKDNEPVDSYEITFTSGWRDCGDAMAAIAGFKMSNVEWTHDNGSHRVVFDTTFPMLKEIQLAIKGSPVSSLRCRRLLREEKANGKD